MPKAVKCFASQCACEVPLSNIPETMRIREISQSRIGLLTEEHCIKTKFRTRLACAKKAPRSSSKWIDASVIDCELLETQCQTSIEEERDRELTVAATEWSKFFSGGTHVNDESTIVGEKESIYENEDYNNRSEEEWQGIQESGNELEIQEDEEDSDGIFEDGFSDVSDDEVLYDKDGNVMSEEDLGKGLREIMEYHMGKLREKLDVFTTLATTEEDEEQIEEEEENGEDEDKMV